jgi:hypothetical protein
MTSCLKFDVIIVPSSNSKVEIASTEIFILEYVQRMMVRGKQGLQPFWWPLVGVDRNQLNEIKFSGLEFPDRLRYLSANLPNSAN